MVMWVFAISLFESFGALISRSFAPPTSRFLAPAAGWGGRDFVNPGYFAPAWYKIFAVRKQGQMKGKIEVREGMSCRSLESPAWVLFALTFALVWCSCFRESRSQEFDANADRHDWKAVVDQVGEFFPPSLYVFLPPIHYPLVTCFTCSIPKNLPNGLLPRYFTYFCRIHSCLRLSFFFHFTTL